MAATQANARGEWDRSIQEEQRRPTFTKMRVYAHVTCSASQTLMLSVRYVLIRLRVYVLFRQPEINYVDDVCFLRVRSTQQKVLWLLGRERGERALLVNGRRVACRTHCG